MPRSGIGLNELLAGKHPPVKHLLLVMTDCKTYVRLRLGTGPLAETREEIVALLNVRNPIAVKGRLRELARHSWVALLGWLPS